MTGRHGRPRLFELHQIAQTYGQDPAALLGVDPRAEPWLAWQVRRAVYAFGTWFDRQREATVERAAPRDAKPTIRVPRFSEEQLRAMLGLDPEDGDAWERPNGAAPAGDLDALALALLRGDGLANG